MNTIECIQSKKAYYEAAIQSEVKLTLPQEEKEQAQVRERKRERASNEFNRMHSVEESLLRSRHSIRSETYAASGRERASTREINRERERERAMNRVECIQSKKACYEAVARSEAKPKMRENSDAVIQSEAKPKMRGNSDAECNQSVPPPKPKFKYEKKQERHRPAIQTGKEARERETRHSVAIRKQEKKQERDRPVIQSPFKQEK
jgi:hypothetical protein